MISLSFAQKENIGFQYVMDALQLNSPYGEERARQLRPFAREQKPELLRQLRLGEVFCIPQLPDGAAGDIIVHGAISSFSLHPAYHRKTLRATYAAWSVLESDSVFYSSVSFSSSGSSSSAMENTAFFSLPQPCALRPDL